MFDSAVFRINEPSVIHQAFDDEVVLVHLATGTYHSLRGTAAKVLQHLTGHGSSSAEIASSLSQIYDAPASAIEIDVRNFITELAGAAIVIETSRNGDTASPDPLPNASSTRVPYAPPALESFEDLQQLVLIDPVHDVSAAGWPRAAAPVGDFALLRCSLAGPSIIFERFDTETVAMNLVTGSFHSLTGTAEALFHLLPQQPTTVELRNAAATHYTLNRATLETDLTTYLDALEESGLILREAVPPEEPQRELDLGAHASSTTYTPPSLETFQQPSLDAPALHSATNAVARDPLPREHYALRAEDLLYSTSSAEIVVADRLEGHYFKLNEPASIVFRMLATGASFEVILNEIRQRYLPQDRSLRVSLMILLSKLTSLGFIEESSVTALHSAVATSTPAPRIPFSGFEMVLYDDLSGLLRPFNIGAYASPTVRLSAVRRAVEVLKEDFTEACAPSGAHESSFNIAGRTVRIQGAIGGHFKDLTRAFGHLQTPAGTPDLTIHIWSSSSHSRDPLLEMSLARLYDHWQRNCGPRGEMLQLHHLPVSAFYHPGPDTLSVVDLESGDAFYLCRNNTPLPSWEYGSPFRNILHPWSASLGLQYTHAGAVGGPRGGVLLAGKGGSGKSTTAMLCAQAGMDYVADDYCLTEARTLQAFSLYNTAKLTGVDDLTRLPAARGHSFNSDGFEQGGTQKSAYTLSDIWPDRLVSSLPLRAILLPTVTAQKESRLEPCSPTDAILALTPSTVAQLHLAGNDDCDRLASLAAQLPAFRLYLGSDLNRIPELLRQFTG